MPEYMHRVEKCLKCGGARRYLGGGAIQRPRPPRREADPPLSVSARLHGSRRSARTWRTSLEHGYGRRTISQRQVTTGRFRLGLPMRKYS